MRKAVCAALLAALAVAAAARPVRRGGRELVVTQGNAAAVVAGKERLDRTDAAAVVEFFFASYLSGGTDWQEFTGDGGRELSALYAEFYGRLRNPEVHILCGTLREAGGSGATMKVVIRGIYDGEFIGGTDDVTLYHARNGEWFIDTIPE